MRRRGAERFMEIGPETADKRFAEELIDTHSFPAALFECRPANVPVMDIQGKAASGQPLHPYGIKAA